MNFDGFSLSPLVRELQQALVGGRIDRITQPNKSSLQIWIRQRGRTFLLHSIVNPQAPAVYLAEQPLESPGEPPVFCMVLRKQIEGARIASITQLGLDRILQIEMDMLGAGGRIISRSLIIEMVGKQSNIILIEEGKILDVLRKVGAQNSRTRQILPNLPYIPPAPQEKLDVRTCTAEEFFAKFKAQGEVKLYKAVLNSVLGFGPYTTREALWRAQLDENLPAHTLPTEAKTKLWQALCSLVTDCMQEVPAPCLAIQARGKVVAGAPFPLHAWVQAEIRTFSTISALLATAINLQGAYQPPEKDSLQRLVRGELARAENKQQVLQKEIAQADDAETQRICADNLMTYAPSFKDHAQAEVSVPNIYSETGENIVIRLDQRLTIMQNAQAYYRRYDKFKRARALLREQLHLCEENIRYLASVEASLASSNTLTEIEEIKAELVATHILRAGGKKKRQDKPSEPLHIVLASGHEVWIGKNNSQNDRLTFRLAASDDLWLHTKDIPGSHVILRLQGDAPTEEEIQQAAILAAYFSKAQGSSNVPVDCTLRRYVKKPSGAKPGFVIFTQQRTHYVTPDETILKNLLPPETRFVP